MCVERNMAASSSNRCYRRKAISIRVRLKPDGTRAETRFRLSAKRTSSFKSTGASVQSTAGSRGVRISGSNAGYTTFRGSVQSTGYPLHSPVSPSFPLPCVTVCHHISTGLYIFWECICSLTYPARDFANAPKKGNGCDFKTILDRRVWVKPWRLQPVSCLDRYCKREQTHSIIATTIVGCLQ